MTASLTETTPVAASTSAIQIRFDEVSLDYLAANRIDTVRALDRISFDIPVGTFLSVVGPSGCGKSTLLSVVAGLVQPSSGTASYLGEPIRSINRKVGFITQRDNLLPWQTVEKNIELPLRIAKIPRAQRMETVEEWMSIVGLEGCARLYPRDLSGGMRQRVSIARTLCYKPETVLLDEPFGALDAQLKVSMQQELLDLWTRVGCTMVFVTHDLGEAALLSDRVVVMSPNPGRVAEVRDIDIPRPRNIREVRFSPDFADLEKDLWAALERQSPGKSKARRDQQRSSGTTEVGRRTNPRAD